MTIFDQLHEEYEASKTYSSDPDWNFVKFLNQRIIEPNAFIARDRNDGTGSIIYSDVPELSEDSYFHGPVIGCLTQSLDIQEGKSARVLLFLE